MPDLPKQSRISPWILGGFVLVLLTVLILLQTSNLWKDLSVETASDTLLLYALISLNFVAFIIFGFIFLRSIVKLNRERRALQLGSKIKTKLLIYFAAISLLPIVAMAGFSYLFMNRALERWFTQIPENVVREARVLQAGSIADRTATRQETADMIAAMLEKSNEIGSDLDNIAAAGNMARIEILSADNSTIAVSRTRVEAQHEGELDTMLARIRDGEILIAGIDDGVGFDASVAEMSNGRKLVIIPTFQDGNNVSHLVDNSLVEFDRLKDKQVTVRQVGFLTLGVLTFLLIFASSWIAFYVARGLTVPIKALAEGADRIAHGDLEHRVNVVAEDELALLVSMFNQMSARLEENAEELNERRRYIETVLQSLPTGVVSFDSENRVSTINRAAVGIFGLRSTSGLMLADLATTESQPILERVIARARRVGRASEQTVLKRAAVGEKPADIPAALSATALPQQNGVVLVVEDLSELIAAQRSSAWQEVARRMAHEIKNPLTPIQLSAERIAKRFGEPSVSERPALASNLGVGSRAYESPAVSADSQTSRVIREGTETILREVLSLKSMVDEFSRFARLPDAKLEALDLNEIVRKLLHLYEDRLDGIRIVQNLAEKLPPTMLDAEQIKRVFVNLIDNAIEAFGESTDRENTITVTTRHDPAREIVVAEVSDNGKGIDPADFQKLFQPYFSTKGRGTGLGLAIVQRIISEHSAKIKVVANHPIGAKFIIEFPVTN